MRIAPSFVAVSLLFLFQPAFASDDDDDDDLAAMQKRLNAEVMEQPFLAEQPAKVESYIKEALKKNLVAPEYSGIYWRRGYTCRDLLRHSWREYRNCRYYYRRHGRYYPYQ